MRDAAALRPEEESGAPPAAAAEGKEEKEVGEEDGGNEPIGGQDAFKDSEGDEEVAAANGLLRNADPPNARDRMDDDEAEAEGAGIAAAAAVEKEGRAAPPIDGGGELRIRTGMGILPGDASRPSSFLGMRRRMGCCCCCVE